DDKYVYWTTFDDNDVRRVPKAGGAQVILARDLNTPAAIAVDANNVYWVNQGAQTILEVAK
ncbi:MAG TPA: hypothetical protein VE987_17585, partial [Polyangiaceae bacterium]|nr:hypothetical protein [Polyangiaceae bacterium]